MTSKIQTESYLAETHVVENVPPPLGENNLYTTDTALVEAVSCFGGNWGKERLEDMGRHCGTAEHQLLGRQANENKPRLVTHDRFGHRIDEVEFHPAYHQLMAFSKLKGLHALPWTEKRPGAHVVRAALNYLHAQVEAGHGCPITMTFACMPTLLKQPDIAGFWIPKIVNPAYDPRNLVNTQKQGLTIGMAMTEKQGGSDVRTNSTLAFPIGSEGPGQVYELVGHKYFVSAPMSDAFLTLARTGDELSCFLIPRWRPDGSKNAMHLTQLKDKMGNASNASSETELRGALGWMIGEQGRGIRNIIEMVALTRFDCMVGSSAGMRQAVTQAVYHTHFRKAFGKKLDQQPLMMNVLADLALEAEAALILSLRMAQALDQSSQHESEKLLVRIGTAVGKYWICKRTPAHTFEAMECIGGSGVMETTPMPRLYREAPVNSIWEGSGNVQCLDVLRTVQKKPESLDIIIDELRTAEGRNRFFDAFLKTMLMEFRNKENLEFRARDLVERIALGWQASLLIRSGNALVSDAFCASRLAGTSGRVFGTLPTGIDCAGLIQRASLAG